MGNRIVLGSFAVDGQHAAAKPDAPVGVWRSWLAHLLWEQGVVGSSPTTPTINENPTMPCDDVTEVLRVLLDPQDRVQGYSLIKQTCGRAVGERSLIHAWAADRTAADILAADLDVFLAAHAPADDSPEAEAEELLALKHLFALQAGLAVVIGEASGAAGETCAIESMVYGPEGCEFIGQVRVDILADKIKACGRCGSGCGKARVAAAAKASAPQSQALREP